MSFTASGRNPAGPPVGSTGRRRESPPKSLLRIKDLWSHFAIKLAESGAQMHDIQQIPGHSSVAVTDRHYAQFSPQHSSKKVLRVLEGGNRNGNII
ncbi:MAG: hypothetical protein ACWGQW_20415 [bacterium]